MTEKDERQEINAWLKLRDAQSLVSILDKNFEKGGDPEKDFGKFLEVQPKPSESQKPDETIEDISGGRANTDDH